MLPGELRIESGLLKRTQKEKPSSFVVKLFMILYSVVFSPARRSDDEIF
jgi:hypothetical protein